MPAWESESAASNKKARTGSKPEDLTVGATVIYHGNKRGTISEAFGIMDEYWVMNEQTEEMVRSEEDGGVICFKASELLLASEAMEESAVEAAATAAAAAAACVVLIGRETHIREALRLFGAPDERQRWDIQMLLGIPTGHCRCGPKCAEFNHWRTSMCDSSCPLCKIASEGIDESMFELAKRLRPDLKIAIRPYYLKQAVEQLSPDLQSLSGYYCLSAVTLPHRTQDIEASVGPERCLREELYCQIDLGTAGLGAQDPGDRSLQDTARRALETTSCIRLSDELWTDEQQLAIRKKLGVVDLPLKYWDDNTKAFVIILPEDAIMRVEKDVVCFKAPGSNAPSAPVGSRDAVKTCEEWAKDQDQFKHLAPLLPGWIRCKSKAGAMYYFNPKTRESTFKEPTLVLPPGWTKETSKTTGKVYYFNAKLRKSSFEVPKE